MARIGVQPLPHGEYHGVVIVGAGVSGLAAAWSLNRQGIPSLVLEQDSVVGGRCATIAHGGALFDVGAQFFALRRPAFQPLLDFWSAAGKLREWSRGFPDISGVTELAGHPRYCGVSGMGDLVEALASGVQVRLNTRVKRIHEARGCWIVEVEGQKRIKADALLLTPPLPLALRLISDENTWRMGALLLPLAGIEYAPRLSMLAIVKGSCPLPEPGAARVDEGAISWIANNHRKGVSPNEGAFTVHGSRAFCAAQRDASLEESGALLREATEAALNRPIVEHHMQRWLYGAPLNTLPRPFYRVDCRAPLFFAGDAFDGGLVEGAAISGLAAARAIAEQIQLTSGKA